MAIYPSYKFTQGAQHFMDQMKTAQKWKEQEDEKLRAAGWIYDGNLGRWTHPNKPDVEIWEG